MIVKPLKFIFLFLFLLVIIPACSFGLWSTPHIIPQDSLSAQLLLRAIEENRSQVKSLRGRARVKVVSTRENLRAQSLIFVKKPAELRLEIISPMNMPLFLFLRNEREWIYYSATDNRHQRGKTEEDTALMGVKVKDIIACATGEISLQPYDSEKAEYVSDGKYSLVTLLTDEGKEKVWVAPDKGQIVKGEFYDLSGEMKLRVVFKEFQKAGDIFFPYQVEIYLPKESTWITLAYEEVYLNGELEDDLFDFVPPPQSEEGGTSLLTPHPR